MSLFTAEELAEDRAEFLTLCSDTLRITRAAKPGDTEYVDTSDIDEDTLQYPEQGRVVIYEGPGRLQVKVDINSNVVEVYIGYLRRKLQAHWPAPLVQTVRGLGYMLKESGGE